MGELNQGKPYVRLNPREPQGVPYNYKDLQRLSSLSEEQADATVAGTTIINNITSSSLSSFAGFADGTAALPGAFWTNDTDSGFYRIGANNIGATTNGVLRFDWNDTRIKCSTGYALFFGTAAGLIAADDAIAIQTTAGIARGVVKSTLTTAGSGWTSLSDLGNHAELSATNSAYVDPVGLLTAGDMWVKLSRADASWGTNVRSLWLANDNNGAIKFQTSRVQRAVILPGGGLCINATAQNASEQLRVNGDVTINTMTSGSALFAGTNGLVSQDTTGPYSFNSSTHVLTIGKAATGTFPFVTTVAFWAHASFNQAVDGNFALAQLTNGDTILNCVTGRSLFLGCNDAYFAELVGGKWGFGSAYSTPARNVDILDASNPQLRLTQASTTQYCDFKVTSAGGLELTPTGTTPSLKVATGVKIGLFGATPVAQATGGENVTNNVTDTGSTNGTIPDITNGTVYATDYTNLRNALFQLARMLKQDHDQLRAMGILS